MVALNSKRRPNGRDRLRPTVFLGSSPLGSYSLALRTVRCRVLRGRRKRALPAMRRVVVDRAPEVDAASGRAHSGREGARVAVESRRPREADRPSVVPPDPQHGVSDLRRRSRRPTTRVLLDAVNKTDAIAELQALRVDRRRGDRPRTGSLVTTVAEVAADWLASLDLRTKHRDPAKRYSPRTVALYRGRMEKHVLPTLGSIPVDELSVADLRKLVEKLGAKFAPQTTTQVISMTSALLRYAVRQKLVERNIVRDLDRDDRPGFARLTEPRYLDATEVAELLAKMGDTFRPIAATCAYAGLRISEALGLTWADVDFDEQRINVSKQLDPDGTIRHQTKTKSSTGFVPLLPALERELREHRARQGGRRRPARRPLRTPRRDDEREAAVATQRAPRRPPRGRRGRTERRGRRAGRPARPPALLRRARARLRRDARRSGRPRATREREGHRPGLRGRQRAGQGEDRLEADRGGLRRVAGRNKGCWARPRSTTAGSGSTSATADGPLGNNGRGAGSLAVRRAQRGPADPKEST